MARKAIELDDFRQRGDAEAAKALEDILARLKKEDKDELMKTLGRWNPSKPQGQLPAPVRDYLELPFKQLPSWVKKEWGRIEKAQQAFQKNEKSHALRARIVLAAYSLPILYIHPEVSLTLSRTGQLLLHVRRRLEDTQAFFDAAMTPGSLEPGKAGQQWIRKVRLTHALIRKTILEEKNQQRAHAPAGPGMQAPSGTVAGQLQIRLHAAVQDPMPLDQVELAFVLQTFGWAIVEGLSRMWWSMSSAEADDHIHAWSAIGCMLGIEEALLPHGKTAVADARALFESIRDAQLRRGDPLDKDPDDKKDTWLAGRLLVAAWITTLVQLQRERTPQNLKPWLERLPWLDGALQQLPRVLIRRLCGVKAARHLRVARAPLLHWLICQLALMLIDVRKIAADEKARPSGAELSGALV